MSVGVGLVGGRGYVGEELLRLLVGHPRFEPLWTVSRSQAGLRVGDRFPGLDLGDMRFEAPAPEALERRGAEAVVLALGNGEAAPWVAALNETPVRLLDVSADYRFDGDWRYGLPELRRAELAGSSRIGNPGCYATAVQLALAPVVRELAAPPAAFGVSGYSGAGRSPSPRNDPERLAENLMPYSLTGHGHEREISHHLDQAVRFFPHVAAFFRGISITVAASLREPTRSEDLLARFQRAYAGEPLVMVQEAIPEVAEVRGTPRTIIGGFAVDPRDPRNAVWVCCLDNLLKGAASQALQNLNLMFGFPETEGLDHG